MSYKLRSSAALKLSNNLSFSNASILFSITIRLVSSSTILIAADSFFTLPKKPNYKSKEFTRCSGFFLFFLFHVDFIYLNTILGK